MFARPPPAPPPIPPPTSLRIPHYHTTPIALLMHTPLPLPPPSSNIPSSSPANKNHVKILSPCRFNAQQLFPLVLDSNDALAPGEMSSSCAARLREAQIGFFSSHACWFNTSSSGDWTAGSLTADVHWSTFQLKRKHLCISFACGVLSLKPPAGSSHRLIPQKVPQLI